MFLPSLQPLTIKVQCTYYSKTEKHMEIYNYINICCLSPICCLWPQFCSNLPNVLIFQGSHGTSTTSSIKVPNFLFVLMAQWDVCSASMWLHEGFKQSSGGFTIWKMSVVGQETMGWPQCKVCTSGGKRFQFQLRNSPQMHKHKSRKKRFNCRDAILWLLWQLEGVIIGIINKHYKIICHSCD